MHDDLVLVIGIVILAAVIIYYLFYSRAAVVKRKLREANQKKIGEFQEGETAKVIGKIKFAGKILKAPLSDRKCVYYHVLIEERRSHGKSSSWVDLIEEEKSGAVVIKDENHYAFIETDLIKSYLIPDRQYNSGFMNNATPKLERFLNLHNKKSAWEIGLNKRIRYKEGVLEEGETIAVAGKGTWKKTSDLGLDIPSEKILVIGSHDDEPVYLSDDPVTTK